MISALERQKQADLRGALYSELILPYWQTPGSNKRLPEKKVQLVLRNKTEFSLRYTHAHTHKLSLYKDTVHHPSVA